MMAAALTGNFIIMSTAYFGFREQWVLSPLAKHPARQPRIRGASMMAAAAAASVQSAAPPGITTDSRA